MEYKSIYEYLGKPAGPELGRIIYKTAKLDKIKIQTQEISNPKFTGQVMMYPVIWLNQYFNKLKESELKDNELSKNNDDLPF